jgi:hypothetical protein
MKGGTIRLSGFWRPRTRPGLIGCALAAGTTAVTSVGSAGAGALSAARSAVSGHVSSIPAQGTPQLAKMGSTEQVRQLAECDGLVYAVGAFTAIEWGGKTYSRHNVFSFSATAPYRVTSWNPDATGVVNSIALAPDCRHAWLGGSFTTVAGTPVRNITQVSTATGSVITSWAHQASRPVDTVLYTPNGHLLAGGKFTSINGSGRAGICFLPNA